MDWFGKDKRDQKWLLDWNFIRLKSDVNTLLDGSSIPDEICHILVVNAYFEWWKKRNRLSTDGASSIYKQVPIFGIKAWYKPRPENLFEPIVCDSNQH